ncbi:hypothetical protein MYEC719_0753 [Escherichia coli]|nr:hypothetical protein MYEC719_0753 [Escherichia coli]
MTELADKIAMTYFDLTSAAFIFSIKESPHFIDLLPVD